MVLVYESGVLLLAPAEGTVLADGGVAWEVVTLPRLSGIVLCEMLTRFEIQDAGSLTVRVPSRHLELVTKLSQPLLIHFDIFGKIYICSFVELYRIALQTVPTNLQLIRKFMSDARETV